MAIPLSKIIKLNEQSDIEAFDFREIEKGTLFVPEPETEDSQENKSPPDPLAELESTIQKRLLEAERRAQELERDAYEKGYAQGQKDGLEYGRKSMQIVKERVEELLGGLQGLPDKVFKEYRDWFLEMCLTISRRIVRRELAAQPEALIQLIDSLLAEAEASQSVTLHLHPSDLEMIKKHTEFLASMERSDSKLTLKPDPQMQRGGCRLESEVQLLDGTVEAQFALFEEALLQYGPHN